MRYLAAVIMVLVSFTTAEALGPIVTKDCVASGPPVTTSGGVALLPADGVVSYKISVSQIAATGGPVLPPSGATVILSAGPSVPICAGLTPGVQYAYWPQATVTPLAPPPGQLPGLPADGAPGVSIPFVMGNTAPATKVPDAPAGWTIR